MTARAVVVGAGPAGLAAAVTLADHGVDITVIDEQARPGGQILRQPPAPFEVDGWMGERIHRPGRTLLERATSHRGIRWRLETSVYGVIGPEPDDGPRSFTLLAGDRNGCEPIAADSILVATGCFELPAPFPGWTLPGVMTAGGIQGFVKSQRMVPGRRFVFAGTHPLQLIVADQVQRAGGEVALVAFAQPLRRALVLAGAPRTALEHAGKLAHAAAAALRLRRAGVAVRFGQSVLRAAGAQAVESVTLAPVDGSGIPDRSRAYEIACDRLGLCHGFVARCELARQAGVVHVPEPDGAWLVTRCDGWMETSRPGLFVAGEVAGLGGADVAREEGYLAGLGILRRHGVLSENEARARAAPIRRRLARERRFAQLLHAFARPPAALLAELATEETLFCKCEEVTVGALHGLLDAHPHLSEATSVKLLSRAGMGFCQGRYCERHLVALVARRRGIPEDRAGAFTAQIPVRPLPVRRLLGLR